MIYEFACDFEINIISTTRKSMARTWDPNADMRLKAKQSNLGMLTTCKQLRIEAQKIYFKHSLFSFSSPIACATWFKRHVPARYQGVVNHLRVACPGDAGMWLSNIKQGRRIPMHKVMAVMTRDQGKETLLHARAQIREPLLSLLPPDALQVEVFDSEWKPTWTSKPDEVKLPRTKMRPARYVFHC